MAKKDKSEKETQIIEVPVSEAPVSADRQTSSFTPLNTLAVVSIASAISWVGAVAGIITGHVALTQIKRSGERGRGLAITGLVLGYLYVAGAIAFGVLGMLFRIRGYAVPDSFGNMGGHVGPGMMGGFDRDHDGPGMGFNH